MTDLIIIIAIVVVIVMLVNKRKGATKSQAPKQRTVGGNMGVATHTGGVSIPNDGFSGSTGSASASTGSASGSTGGSASAGFSDDGSEFRFGSDDDFAAALSALTGEEPAAVTGGNEAPATIIDEEEPQGISGGAGSTGFTGSGVVRCKINGEYDREGTSARFENGKVYGLSTHGEYLIGSYNEECTEVRNSRDELIGRIDGNLIILTREGQVERLKAQGREKTPDDLVLLCAERKGNCIRSTENGEELALCGSDDPASAAAFICLHYDGDGIGPKESELHRFWSSWM